MLWEIKRSLALGPSRYEVHAQEMPGAFLYFRRALGLFAISYILNLLTEESMTLRGQSVFSISKTELSFLFAFWILVFRET